VSRHITTTRIAIGGALIVAAALLTLTVLRSRVIPVVGLIINYVRSLDASPGILTIEAADAAGGAEAASEAAAPPAAPAAADWPSYNRTVGSERYSPLRQIDRTNVANIRVQCVYDTGEHTSFQAGPLVVDGALIGTTEEDIFSIDAITCAENWRTHEDFKHIAVNRGAAYMDGLLYRGSGDGRVLAYDFRTGARVWDTTIADVQHGESVSAAPIVWNGLIFIGNAGGDYKGGKGRMYALDAKSGKVIWEFYLVPKGPEETARGAQGATPLDTSTWGNQAGTPITGGATWTSYTLDLATGELYVPAGNSAPDFATGPREGPNLYSGSVVVLDAKTGAYKRHYKLTSGDWHDWDVSNTPALIQSRNGNRLLAVAPKDGYLYGFNLDSNALIYRMAVTTIENADVRFASGKAVHFCPGARGGAEWNSPAYDPQTNLLLIGEVDWCATITLQSDAQIQATKMGRAWSAMATHNPYNVYGRQDPYRSAAGWLYATDADSGAWKWRAKSNYPIQGAITPTAGGVVFFGDMGGNFYALDKATGQRLWGQNLGGAIGGGLITYLAGGAQKVAVSVGFTSILWPTKVVTGKVVILGLERAEAR
jgi:alcohol dehydrogenase (cytochrome c)